MDVELQEPMPAPVPMRGGGGRDLTTGNVLRHVITFSIPMLMGSMFHTAYMIINAAWIGNGLGAESMAAVTVSFPIFFVLMAVAGGLTLASNILVSQAFGAKDSVRLRLVIQNSLVLTGIVAVGCVAVGFFGAGPILRWMQTPPEVLPLAVGYLRLFIWTTPFMFGVFYQASIMRGVGDSKTPLYFQMISLILNVALDPLLMFGWLGFPRLGLNGTAVATIVAQAVAFGSIALYVQRCKHVAAPDWRRLRLDGPTTLLTLKLGIPSMLQQALVSLGFIVFVGLVNGFGTHSAAAYGIASRIDQLAFMPAMAIGMAISTLAGQNIGAGRLDRVRESLWWGMAISCSITLVGCFAAFVIPEFLMRLFSHDADVVATGAGYLRIVAWGYLMFAVMFASNGVVNGAGHTFATTLFTFIAFWLVRIPLAIYLAHHWGRVEGLWVAHVCGLAAGTITSLAYYFSGLWKKTTIRRRVPATGVVSE